MARVPIVDALAFSKVKARLGGRVHLVASGAAPLASHVEKFLKVTMCAPVTQARVPTSCCCIVHAVRMPMKAPPMPMEAPVALGPR